MELLMTSNCRTKTKSHLANMRNLISSGALLFFVAALQSLSPYIALMAALTVANPAQAQWLTTNCVGASNGVTYVITDAFGPEHCRERVLSCTGNPAAGWQWFPQGTTVRPPLRTCTSR
jgi:hypothetical protein